MIQMTAYAVLRMGKYRLKHAKIVRDNLKYLPETFNMKEFPELLLDRRRCYYAQPRRCINSRRIGIASDELAGAYRELQSVALSLRYGN